jgi:hypothetical protein
MTLVVYLHSTLQHCNTMTRSQYANAHEPVLKGSSSLDEHGKLCRKAGVLGHDQSVRLTMYLKATSPDGRRAELMLERRIAGPGPHGT